LASKYSRTPNSQVGALAACLILSPHHFERR